jgi:hypothetical protein
MQAHDNANSAHVLKLDPADPQKRVSNRRLSMKKVALGALAALFLLLLVSIAVAGRAKASSGGDYELSWWTIDGGGGSSSGGSYALSGTIGQPDAGSASGGDYQVSGGFWGRFVEALYELFLPLIVR